MPLATSPAGFPSPLPFVHSNVPSTRSPRPLPPLSPLSPPPSVPLIPSASKKRRPGSRAARCASHHPAAPHLGLQKRPRAITALHTGQCRPVFSACSFCRLQPSPLRHSPATASLSHALLNQISTPRPPTSDQKSPARRSRTLCDSSRWTAPRGRKPIRLPPLVYRSLPRTLLCSTGLFRHAVAGSTDTSRPPKTFCTTSAAPRRVLVTLVISHDAHPGPPPSSWPGYSGRAWILNQLAGPAGLDRASPIRSHRRGPRSSRHPA